MAHIKEGVYHAICLDCYTYFSWTRKYQLWDCRCSECYSERLRPVYDVLVKHVKSSDSPPLYNDYEDDGCPEELNFDD